MGLEQSKMWAVGDKWPVPDYLTAGTHQEASANQPTAAVARTRDSGWTTLGLGPVTATTHIQGFAGGKMPPTGKLGRHLAFKGGLDSLYFGQHSQHLRLGVGQRPQFTSSEPLISGPKGAVTPLPCQPGERPKPSRCVGRSLACRNGVLTLQQGSAV
jgi:hypothetical protein